MAQREFSTTRINNDVNGNPRYVVHYLDMLTQDEKRSSFLTWAGVKYQLALLRSATMGGKKYHNKSYGGGIVFQSYNIEYELNQCFDRFENSADYVKAHNHMALVVLNDFPLYEECRAHMQKVYHRKNTAQNAFHEIMYVCEAAAKKFKVRTSYKARFIAACLVILSMEELFTE